MRNQIESKSRAKLYKAINGIKSIVGAGGREATGSITFLNIPIAGETVTIGGYVFSFQAAASEAAGTSAGTAADPHLVTYGGNLAAATAALASQILAETATTGRWGYLNPDDSDAIVDSGTAITLRFWPGEWANSVVLAGSAGDETIVQPSVASLGRSAPTISLDDRTTSIDTTASTQNEEYYVLADGQYVGQEVQIVFTAIGASDTPTILGHFFTSTGVQAQFNAAQDVAKFVWTGLSWKDISVTAEAVYTASA